MIPNSELKARARMQLGSSIFSNNWMMALLACLIFSAITGAAGSIIPGVGAFVVIGPMSAGLCFFFIMQLRTGATDLGGLFEGFKRDFSGTFVLGLLISIFTFLWSLLFLIPGIVMSYAYSMAFYIKLDHPEYDWRTCIDQSKAMMDGHKGELFYLDLSFIGWYLVGALCCGVGTLWVAPYHAAAKAQFYQALISAPAQGQYTAPDQNQPL